jgi:multiple sugar transport system permease protein
MSAMAQRPATRQTPATNRRRIRPLTVVFMVLMTVFAVVYVFPFLIEVATSFKTDPDASNNALSLIPHPPTVAAYKEMFGLVPGTPAPLGQWFFNSVIVTVFVVVGRVFFDSVGGYALSRLRFRGRAFVFAGVVAIIAVPSIVLMIPEFLVLKTLGIFNTYTGMVLPLMVDAAGVFIMKQFFDSIPREVEEAARVDGAGYFRTYWSVVLPMARPALLTLTILSFQGAWNAFTQLLVATSSAQYDTLTTGLARLVSGSLGAGNQYPLKLGAAMLSTIPVAVLFFVFQRYFVRGANSGAVKQ